MAPGFACLICGFSTSDMLDACPRGPHSLGAGSWGLRFDRHPEWQAPPRDARPVHCPISALIRTRPWFLCEWIARALR